MAKSFPNFITHAAVTADTLARLAVLGGESSIPQPSGQLIFVHGVCCLVMTALLIYLSLLVIIACVIGLLVLVM